MKQSIYLSGPITGLAELNLPTFRECEETLKAQGYKVCVPHDLFDGLDTKDWEHKDYMRVCIAAMMSYDKVVTITGWENSQGANMEVDIARRLSIPVEPITYYLKPSVDAA